MGRKKNTRDEVIFALKDTLGMKDWRFQLDARPRHDERGEAAARTRVGQKLKKDKKLGQLEYPAKVRYLKQLMSNMDTAAATLGADIFETFPTRQARQAFYRAVTGREWKGGWSTRDPLWRALTRGGGHALLPRFWTLLSR